MELLDEQNEDIIDSNNPFFGKFFGKSFEEKEQAEKKVSYERTNLEGASIL